jgi:lambda family phage portal protein
MRRAQLPTPSRFDKALSAVVPGLALKRYRNKCALAMAGAYTGASKTKRSMTNWVNPNGDFDSDVLHELPDLRDRSEALYRNNMLATGAINTKVTAVVGRGLTMQSRIDASVLGLSEEQADAWEAAAERSWLGWSESKFCTVNRKHNFRELQSVAFLSKLLRGDSFVLTPEKNPTSNFQHKLRVQLVEADRVCNEDNQADSATLAGGIETYTDGALKQAHIMSGHPGNYNKNDYKWQKVPFFGAKTGRKNVLHLFSTIRGDQSRGVPDLAPVIEGLKQFGTFTQATVDAAVIQTFLSVFIETTDGEGIDLEPGTNDDNVKLAAAAIVELGEGEKPHFMNPTHPNSNYGGFANEFYCQLGAALSIPKELLIKHFSASYSASQAALLEAWRFFRTVRSWLVDNLCQPVYELHLAEEISCGRLSAPGFFISSEIRAAYCGADWVGPPRGHIREDVQNKADGYAEDRGWKTAAQNTQERDGIWERNHRQRVKEVTRRRDDGLITTTEDEGVEDLLDVEE